MILLIGVVYIDHNNSLNSTSSCLVWFTVMYRSVQKGGVLIRYNCINMKNFTVKEVAKRLKVSERTILREIKRGNLSAFRAGRKYLISGESLQNYSQKEKGHIGESVDKFLETQKSEMISLLQKIVSLPSEAGGRDNEKILADFLHEKLEKLGIRSYVYGEGESVVVNGSFGIGQKGLLFDCPLDTAEVGDRTKWDFPPFGGVIKDGKMYGRGVADSKAGIVSMIYAVVAMKKLMGEDDLRVELVFDGGEHHGKYTGFRNLLAKGLDIEAAVIGYAQDEKDSREIGIGCRGYQRYELKTFGRSAHTGSRYAKSVNAIHKMARFIRECEKEPFPSPKSEQFYFGTKLNFSNIEGGVAINIVPDECRSQIDVRTLPSQSKKDVEKYLDKIALKCEERDGEFGIEKEYIVGDEGYVLDREKRIVEVLNKGYKKVYKKKPEMVVHGAAHIGTLLYQNNIPTVVWGPQGDNLHSYNEYVEVDSLVKTAAVYAEVIREWFG